MNKLRFVPSGGEILQQKQGNEGDSSVLIYIYPIIVISEYNTS